MSEKQVLIVTTYSLSRVATSSPINNISEMLHRHGYSTAVVYSHTDNGDLDDSTRMPASIYEFIPVRLGFRGSLLLFAMRILQLTSRNCYEFVVSVDTRALLATYLISIAKRIHHVHLSFELSCFDGAVLKQRLLDVAEKRALRKADRIIIQDRGRLNALAGSVDIGRANVSFLPVSRIGLYDGERKHLFHDKFDIDRGKRIVLCTGSLIKEHLIHEIAESVKSWPDNCVLVMHGWFWPDTYRQQVLQIAEQYPGKVYISTDLVSQNEIDEVFASVDIGLAFYAPVDDNFRLIGQAAGKVFDYMRYGIPIIVNQDTNAYQLVEENHCGTSVRRPDELGRSISYLLEHHSEYRRNCFAAFEEFEFSSRFKSILTELPGGKEALKS